MFSYAYKRNTIQVCRLESSPYIPPGQEKSIYLKYPKLNQPMLFPSKISNHLSPINRTFPACGMPPRKKSPDSTTWNHSIHPLTTKRQPIQPSKRWTQLFNISLKNCFLIADFKIRSTPNSNVNASIGEWSRGLSDQRMRWGIVYSRRRLTNSLWRPITIICNLFWCSRHCDTFNRAIVPHWQKAQNSLVTYLRGFPLGQCRNSQMMAEAWGFPPCAMEVSIATPHCHGAIRTSR